MIPDLQQNRRMNVIMIWLAGLLAFVMLVWTVQAVSAAQCLTKEQARAKWPSAHLFWHTSERCWDNRAGRGGDYGKRESKPDLKPRPAPPARVDDANGNAAIAAASFNEIDAAAGPAIIYPDLLPGQSIDASMLTPVAITKWPHLIDIDLATGGFDPWQNRIAGAFSR